MNQTQVPSEFAMRGPRPAARRVTGGTGLRSLLSATALSLSVVGLLQVLNHEALAGQLLPGYLRWGRDAALVLPLACVAVVFAERVGAAYAERVGAAFAVTACARLAGALAGGTAFAVMWIPAGKVHQLLFPNEASATWVLADAMAAWLAATTVVLLVHVAGRLWAARERHEVGCRRPVAVAVTVSLMQAGLTVPGLISSAAAAAPSCAVTRAYQVDAINVDIPYNRWGTNSEAGTTNLDADGMVYVLRQDKEAVKNWDVPLGHKRGPDDSYVKLAAGESDPTSGRRLRPRPLMLRANVGDCVKVTFTNDLNERQFGGELASPRASIHVHGAAYDVQTSDGSKVGFNDDTTVGRGSSIQYTWLAPAQEGAYLFHDHGALAGSEGDGGATVHGLFGALAVEPAGSSWADPVSGARLDTPTPYTDVAGQSGELYVDAVITPPTAASFRESVQLGQDEIPGIGFGFNYGSEPGARREEQKCPDCVGEETSLSSWTYGDPALVKLASGKGPWLPKDGLDKAEDCGLRRQDSAGKVTGSCWTSNVTHAYSKDPITFRYGLVGVKETHVFHMHAHQWLVEPKDDAVSPETGNPQSTKVDSQTFGPGEMFNAELIGGAGSLPGTVGDTIFHCHLYPHFAQGFWALLRVHDVHEDGTGTTPDGIGVRELRTLADRAAKPGPTVTSPGYPRFIPGQVGWRAPQPYLGVSEPSGAADLPATVAREDLVQAKRMVAGRYLDPAVLEKAQRITSTSAGIHEVQEVDNTSGPRAEEQVITMQATGGSFSVVADPMAQGLPYDVSPGVLEAAVERAVGIGVTTVPTDTASSGGSWSWRFRYDVVGDRPELALQTATLQGTATATTLVQGGTGGTFTLGYGLSNPVELAFDATAEQMQAAVNLLGARATVRKSDGLNRWELTFTELGDVSEFTVDGAGLTSGDARVTTRTAGTPDGSFTLSFGSRSTSPIPHGASAAEVQAALEALDNIDSVRVTGASPYVVTLVRWSPVDSLLIGAMGAVNDPDPGIVGADVDETTQIARLAHQLMVEKGALTAAHASAVPATTPLPGAPMVDACPAGARTVTYNVSVIQRDVVYNEGGWHDTQGRLYVLDRDVAAVLAGTKDPEPLFIRVNAGDCINFNLTSYLPNWIGGDAFIELAQTNMVGGHIHLVKFDVLGSDGSSNGWNYQQAAFTKEQMDFNAGIAADPGRCRPTSCRITTPASTYSPVGPGPVGAQGSRGQTIHERWYADSELRTVFTHDHHFPAQMQNRGQYGALVVEPAGMSMRNPFTGAMYRPGSDCSAPDAPNGCVGDAAGTKMDILGSGTNDDFREFGLSFQDFVSLTKPGGDPTNAADTFNPPAKPEKSPDDDPGVMGINYRNAPFLLRDHKNGAWVDPAYRFSSTVFGDPKTPLLQAYAGDKVRIRLIQGSQEEQNVWALHGMRWREEPDDPQSPLVNAKALGISDAPNFEIPPLPCGIDEDCQGDFMYSSTSTDATYLGMWGIMRVYGKGTNNLLALPDNVPQAVNGRVNFQADPDALSAPAVPAGKKGGDVCPPTAVTKRFDLFATDGKIEYNRQGDNDPYGLMYGLVQDGETPEQALARVRREQVPLVVRANAGDCLEVSLTNRIDPAGAFATQHAGQGAALSTFGGDPTLPLEPPAGTRAGLRVSLHPQLLRYDVRYSDGATVGFNRDQTVGPGQSILYRWWADDVTPGELGATNLVDFGDVRGHRHHGLFAGLIIEPKGATYHDPFTGAPVASGASADIRVPNAPDFREDVPFFQDGLNLRDVANQPIEQPPHPGATAPEPLDAEDQGEKGFNYRSSPFRHRGDPLLEMPGAAQGTIDGARLANVFSSVDNGEPDTPIFRAYTGDPVRVRLLQGSDKPRQHSFQISGHAWRSQAHDPDSNLVGTSGGLSGARTLNIHLDQAGGLWGGAGDYRYNCGVAFHHQSGGLWGIQRVYSPPNPGYFRPDQLGSGADPQSGDNPRRSSYHPIQPLEQNSVSVTVYRDSNRNKVRGSDEAAMPDVDVELHAALADGTAGALLETGKTDAAGRVFFNVRPDVYDVVVKDRPDFAATTPGTARVIATQDAPSPGADFGQVQLANVSVRVFNDRNGNLEPDPDETAMNGWTVSVGGEGVALSSPVQGGVAAFTDLLPGTYKATVTPGAGYYSTTHASMPVTVPVAENADLTGDRELRVGYALQAGVSVHVFNDSNRNGAQEPGESSLAGRTLDVTGGPQTTVVTSASTDAGGNAVIDDPDPAIVGLVPGAYHLAQKLSADWSLAGASRIVSTAEGTPSAEQQLPVEVGPGSGVVPVGVEEQTSQIITLRNHNPKGWVSAVPFNDVNNDGVRQDKESKLVGWRAELYDAAGQLKAVTTTDNAGRASWYVDQAGGVDSPVRYSVTMAPREVGDTDIPWTATTSGRVDVDAVSGETRTANFGFVQLGTIGASVWHDLDRDGVDSGRGEALANRTVRLYDAGGKKLLQQRVTDATGMASFKAAAGVDYQLEVLLPSEWLATAPLSSKGAPITKIKVTGPTGITSSNTAFGQYNSNDRTPPPAPSFDVPEGQYDVAQTVRLSSEAGASLRYTLDGDLPTATSGMLYTGPVTIGSSKVITAVAVDAAGNASEVTTAAYTIAGATSLPAPPTSWTTTTGTTRGSLADVAVKDDGKRMYLTAKGSGSKYATDGYASFTVDPAQRDLLGLGIAYEARASVENVTRTLQMYNWATRKYETVRDPEREALSDSRVVLDVAGDPTRFRDARTGEVRVRVLAKGSKPFEVGVDQLSLTVRFPA